MAKHVDQAIVNDLRRFDFVAQNIWPHFRKFFKKSIAPRCKECVLSSRVSYMNIKDDGICNLCHDHKKLLNNPEEKVWQEKYILHQQNALKELITTHENKSKSRWDALVLFSGGKDSVYMVSRLRKEYPNLRILLMTWNNGFYSKVALERAIEVAAKLDVDHFVFKPKSSVYKTLYRYTLQNVENKGSYQTVDRLDGTLNQLLGVHYAYEMNIPLVLAGVDFAQEIIMQFHSYFDMPFEDMCSRTLVDRMERRSGFSIKNIFTEEDQKLFWDGTNKDPERIPHYVCPFVAWRPDKGAIKKQLADEGLLPVKDSSPILTNNQVLSVMSAIDIRTIGYSSFEPEFSEMIRYRENEPDYWRNVFEFLEFSVRSKYIVHKTVDRVLKKLGLTLKDVKLDI